jgi:hypothetical protein
LLSFLLVPYAEEGDNPHPNFSKMLPLLCPPSPPLAILLSLLDCYLMGPSQRIPLGKQNAWHKTGAH